MPRVHIEFTKKYKTRAECEFFIECAEKDQDVKYLKLEILEDE